MIHNALPDITLAQLERYVALGWSLVMTHGVMPGWPAPDDNACTCWNQHACESPGKHPAQLWRGVKTAAMRDLIRSREDYLSRPGSFEPNWAVKLGASGLACIEFDRHAGGPDGAAAFAELERRYGPLPASPKDTRNHHFFASPPNAENWPTKIVLAPGVEMFVGNSQADHLVYIPPSNHRDGSSYRWYSGLEPWEHGLPNLPGWSVEIADCYVAQRGKEKTANAGMTTAPRSLRFVGSHCTYDSHALTRAAAYLATIPGAVSGQRGHDQTFKVACKLIIDFGLSVADALPLMMQWNQVCLPPWTEAEILHKLRDADRQPGVRGRLLDLHSSRDNRWANVNFEIIWPHKSWSHPRSTSAPVQANGTDGAAAMGEFDDLGSPSAARAAREAEAEAKEANRLIAEVHNCHTPYCPRCDRTLLQRRKDGRTIILHTRCNSWKCHTACAKVLKERWQNNFKLRLGDPAMAGVVLYSATISGVPWRTVLKRLRRAGAEYFRFSPDGGQTFIIIATSPPTSEVNEVTPAEAVETLSLLVDRYVGDSPPLSSSAAWRLPVRRLPTGPPVYKRIGKVHDSLSDEEIESFADRNGCHVGQEPSVNTDERVQARVGIVTPPSWSGDRLWWFHNCITTGVVDVPYCEPGFFDNDQYAEAESGENRGGELDLIGVSP